MKLARLDGSLAVNEDAPRGQGSNIFRFEGLPFPMPSTAPHPELWPLEKASPGGGRGARGWRGRPGEASHWLGDVAHRKEGSHSSNLTQRW